MQQDEKGNRKSSKFCDIYYIKTMEMYCVSCKKNAVNGNSNTRKIKQNRLIILSNYAICGKKKLKILKTQKIK